jgi:hypothetical protein
MVIIGTFNTTPNWMDVENKHILAKTLFTFLFVVEVLLRNRACESMVMGLLLFHEP